MDNGFDDISPVSRERFVPANPEAEQAVLGSLLIDPDAVIKVASFLQAEDFYQEKNGWIYQAIVDLHERRDPADFVTVTDELERRRQLIEVGGAAYVMDLINAVPTAIHVEHYGHIVERASVLRQLIRAAGQIAQLAYEDTAENVQEVVDRAEQIIFGVAEERTDRDLVPVRSIMGEVVDRIDFLYHHRGEILGVPTGFKLLDKMLGGLQKSDLVILAARPGVGKCIVSGSRLLDPTSGRLVPIDEMIQTRAGHLVTMDADLRLQSAQPVDFVDDGIKPVYRVQTALGRELTTTLSHPFFTIGGWKPLSDLAVGVRIAVPRALPFFGAQELPEGQVKALAYLIADGCLTGTCPQFTNANPKLRDDFIEAVGSFPGITTRIEASQGTRTSSVCVAGDVDFIREHRRAFAERVRATMDTQSLSQKQLSSRIGVSPTLMRHWTIAKGVPNAESFARLCDELGVPAEQLAPTGLPSISKNGKNSLTVWLQDFGLWGKTAHAKRVPAPVFELTRPQIALFLNRLFACDGSIYFSGDDLPRLSYATVSLELARDVQHLLLRFGLLAKLRRRKMRYKGELRAVYELIILDRRSVDRFLDEIGIFGKEEKVEEARRRCLDGESNPNLDTVPVEVWSRVVAAKGQRSWRSLYQQLGYPLESNSHVHRRAPGRQRLAQLAELFENQELVNLATSDLYWDTIESIEYVGERQVYDLTVENTHNFVAEDMLVHNTSLAISIAQAAARKYGKRVAVFSLEMSNEQLVQRMLAAETGIDSQRLRLGDIHGEDEWHRLMEAAGALSDAPIFIDDTPAISVLELRTKARRLYAEHDLDMVVVDYLQLMTGGDKRNENRVQEISNISRGLKSLARELNVPVLALSQLSRAVEGRQDKRPILSDLRESGCLTGDTRVFLPDSGRYAPIREIVGTSGFQVAALNTNSWRIETATVSRSFSTGTKPVFRLETRLGRFIRATANHRFLTIDGWRRLDELEPGRHIALPRILDHRGDHSMADAELALLGHLIGDGCMLPRHAIQYTTREKDLADLVASLATAVFNGEVDPRVQQEPGHDWYQVFIPTTRHITHGVRNPVSDWLDSMGVFGLRSHEKHVPDAVYSQSTKGVATFLRHLWATDGCIRMRGGKKHYPAIYYASSSRRLVCDVQSLLTRLGICARLKRVAQNGKGRDQFHVIVSGKEDMLRFAETVGAAGAYKTDALNQIVDFLNQQTANTNRDVIPAMIWTTLVRPSMVERGITHRQLHAELEMAYAGTAVFKQNVSRDRARRVADVVQSDELLRLADSDVYWDQVHSIQPDGMEEVFDLTVPGTHNFVANDIVVHNSIEQDADVVMFIYREEMYVEETDRQNIADIIVSKHRNGPTGAVSLFFRKELTQFRDLEIRKEGLE